MEMEGIITREKSQSLRTDQGNSDAAFALATLLGITESQSLRTDQGNSDWPTAIPAETFLHWSQSLRTDQGNSDIWEHGPPIEGTVSSQSLRTDQGNSDSGLSRLFILRDLKCPKLWTPKIGHNASPRLFPASPLQHKRLISLPSPPALNLPSKWHFCAGMTFS
jgi:hypothetical protein